MALRQSIVSLVLGALLFELPPPRNGGFGLVVCHGVVFFSEILHTKKDPQDPPMVSGERTCMTQGCFGPQNDASFEGPMILTRWAPTSYK